MTILALALCQEPAPAPPVPQLPQQQEPQSEQSPNDALRQDVEAKLAKVSATFAEADRSLTQSVDAPAEMLAEAAAVAARLVAEMEELLAALPAPPPPPPNSKGNCKGDKEEKDGNKPAQHSPPPKEESNKGKLTPPRDMSLSEFLRDPRDGSWGKLPPRLQQTIDSASAEEVPLRYRRWLVEYHRQGIKAPK